MRLNIEFMEEFKDYDFSVIKEEKIGLVGSARFLDFFIKIESILQILHYKIVSIASMDGLLHKEKFSEDEWESLQKTALKKLEYQQALLVLNVGGYVGDHTREELELFENELKRPIYYLTELKK